MSKKSKERRKKERAMRFGHAQVKTKHKNKQNNPLDNIELCLEGQTATYIGKPETKTEVKKVDSGSVLKTFKPKKYIPCHEVTEIYHNFFLGSFKQSYLMASSGVDCLFPLDSLDGDIWDVFNGEIHYYPTTDYKTLPTNILDRCVNDIIGCLKSNKSVGLFCLGGHGRTGYIAACVLGKLGIDDPIQLIHDKYCKKAIESREQYKHISQYLKKPELFDKHYNTEDDWFGFGGYGYGGAYGGFEVYDNFSDYYNKIFNSFSGNYPNNNPFVIIDEDDEDDDEEEIIVV